jgi:hypothetical protein
LQQRGALQADLLTYLWQLCVESAPMDSKIENSNVFVLNEDGALRLPAGERRTA